jgi:hypothetical protein
VHAHGGADRAVRPGDRGIAQLARPATLADPVLLSVDHIALHSRLWCRDIQGARIDKARFPGAKMRGCLSFAFPPKMAECIQKRRGRLFHSVPEMSEQDVMPFCREVQAVTGLLMLHTYDDLGIDISCLAGQYSALSDIRFFLVPPDPSHKGAQTKDETEPLAYPSEPEATVEWPASASRSVGTPASGE